ncbi:MAG: DUF3667 domain-containing protein [Rhodothalassiaceae bacterium]
MTSNAPEAERTRLKRCMNCGAAVTGSYCPDCGQKDDDLRRPLYTFLVNFLDDVFSLESRALRTMATLIAFPGRMTRRYVQGRRQSYTPPLRLYLITSLLFFLTLGATDIALIGFTLDQNGADPVTNGVEGPGAAQDAPPEPSSPPSESAQTQPDERTVEIDESTRITIGSEDLSPEEGEEVAQFAESMVSALGGCQVRTRLFLPAEAVTRHDPECRAALDKQLAGTHLPEQVGFLERLVLGFQRSLDDPARLNRAFNTWLPRAMVLLLPLMAVGLSVLHRRRGQYFFNHLVFSLHFHTFVFVLMIVLVLWARGVGPLPPGHWVSLLVLIYFIVAMKHAYQQGWIKTVLKSAVIAIGHSLVLLLTVSGIVYAGLQDI